MKLRIHPIPKPAIILGFGLFIILTFVLPLKWLLRNRALDLPSYYVAGVLVADGRNPYHHMEIGMTAQSLGLANPIYPYIYPPALALAFTAVSTINYVLVQIGWFCLTTVFLWMALLVLFDIMKQSCSDNSVCLFWLVMSSSISFPVINNFHNGQINTIILFLLAAYLHAMKKQSPWMAGVLLGFCCLIKPQPLILLPFLFLIGEFICGLTTIAVYAAGFVATGSVVGMDSIRFYLTQVLPTFNMVKTSFPPILIFYSGNHSIQGLISRSMITSKYSQSLFDAPDLIPIATKSASIFIIVFALFIIFMNHRHYPLDRGFPTVFRDTSLLIMVSLLVSPLTWDHHLLMLMLPMAFHIHSIVRRKHLNTMDLLIGILFLILNLNWVPIHPIWLRSGIWTLGMSIKTFTLSGLLILYVMRYYVKPATPETECAVTAGI